MKTFKLLFFLLTISLFMSCVSSKKYEDLLQSKATVENAYKNYKKKQTKTIKDLKSEISNYQAVLNKMRLDSAALAIDLQNVKVDKTNIENRYNQLLKQNQLEVSSASSEKQELTEALAIKQRELDDKEKALKTLEASLKTSTNALKQAEAALATKEENVAKLQAALEMREKRVNELESVLKSQEEKVAQLRNKVTNALLGFNESELTIEQRDGKVYVSLSQNLLFASGSTNIDKKGKDALRKLAEVLSKSEDFDIVVEGHTDNVPLSGRGAMKDNWDLSVLRSTSIVRELVKGGINPSRVIPSGRGEFQPKGDNTTRDGRAENRRSEIILSPKLDELYDLIKN